jgi:hypothetical protein
MAKNSPAQNVFEGEFSPLAEGRTDIQRYPRAMRYMSNMVPCRTGPAIGRSGTYYENKCFDPAYPSKLLPFAYNEEETLVLEFGHYTLRFLYEYQGVAAHREVTITSVTTVNPFTYMAPGTDVQVNEHVIFSNCPPEWNVNAVIMKVTAVNPATGQVTTDYTQAQAGSAPSSSAQMAVVYEIVTPYSRDDVQNIRIAQELNIVYMFCFHADGSGDYRPYYLQRYDTFNWVCVPWMLNDGPYMDVNITPTVLLPTGTGTWIPNMTANNAPAPGVANADTEAVGHEAFRAFDGTIDTYWEGTTNQTGFLAFTFDSGFVNNLPVFAGPTSGGMTITGPTLLAGYEAWRVADRNPETEWLANVPATWMIDKGVAKTVLEYRLRGSANHPEYSPRDWTLQGSAAPTGPWTIVDTRSGYVFKSGQLIHFTVQTPGSYRYYQLVITAVNRKHITVIHPQVGKKGKKGYVPRYTTTSLSLNRTAFAEVEMCWTAGKPRIVDGYAMYLGRVNVDADMLNHAPKTWYFEAYNGVSWVMLHAQANYTNWGNYRSQYFPVPNQDAYLAYRIRIAAVVSPGNFVPRIGKLVLSSPDAPPIQLLASSVVGINDNQGFLPTDVGRLLRLTDVDNTWRWVYIASVVHSTRITLQFVSNDPLVLNWRVQLWRLGLWSDTTGWPTVGVIHEDRLFCSGSSGFPDHVVGSYQGNHLFFQQIGVTDIVLDAHAIVARCNNRYMSKVVWLKSAIEALRIGTGTGEFVMSSPSGEALSARSFSMRQTTKRGSPPHEPLTIDTDVVFLQNGQRALYALGYQAASLASVATYKSVLVSKLGSHLMWPPVVQIVYQQEPHGIIWGRRSDGSIAAMSYSTDDDIFGGHRHDFGGVVQDLCSVYSPTDKADSLWMVIQRTVNGQTVNFIERLCRFWDYSDILEEDATFVDCALRYLGDTDTQLVYGLGHLEGQYLSVLADNITYLDRGPVTNGALQLDRPAYNIVVGLPLTMEGEIIAPETGAQDGTAQGKSKRPHSVVLRLWQSARGEVGRWDEDHGTVEWTPVEYNFPGATTIPEVTLRTCLSNTTVLPGGYGTLGTVRFRQAEPLPFNVAGVYPQGYVEDER